jgi:hypothetical protein
VVAKVALGGGWVASGSSSPLRLRRAPPSAHRGCQTLQATVQETLQDTPSRRIIETFALSSSVESLGPMTQAVMEGARLRSALSRGEGRLDHGRRERVVGTLSVGKSKQYNSDRSLVHVVAINRSFV